MGEEEKKPEEPKNKEAEKKDEAEKKENGAKAKESPPPPATEVVLKVFMHCEGCARKVRRCLRGFEGVEDVMTDCKSSKVVVKGEKAAMDPLKVLERVQRKSHRQVELISPIPKPPQKEAAEEKPKEKEEKPKPEEKKEEVKVIVVMLKVHMHCEACAQEIKKRILRMKGVESAEPDLKRSEVAVKGVFEPGKLVEYVYKRTGKHAAIVKQEPESKPEKKEGGEEEKPKEEAEAPAKEEKKEGGEEKKKEGGEEKPKEKESKENEGEAKTEEGKEEEEEETEETKLVELKRNEFQYYPPRYGMELYAYPPPPQMFSDENPNACSVM